MKEDEDFSKGKRGAVDPIPPGKTRITIRIDDDVLEWFKNQVEEAGGGSYQAMMNEALRKHIESAKGSLSDEILKSLVEQQKVLAEILHEQKAMKASYQRGRATT